jgi:hypothetical protein
VGEETKLLLEWREGPPPKPWGEEWFIALTTYGDRVVLRALPEEHSYDFKTADETYIKADRIAKWMQFPDSQFVAPRPPAPTSGVTEAVDERTGEELSLCEACCQPVRRGQFINVYDVGPVHIDCANPDATTDPDVECDESGPVYVMLGNPLRYYRAVEPAAMSAARPAVDEPFSRPGETEAIADAARHFGLDSPTIGGHNADGEGR